jgi:hypothetical protein
MSQPHLIRGVCPKCGTKIEADLRPRKRWPAAFDRAFALMDRAFAEISKGFRSIER